MTRIIDRTTGAVIGALAIALIAVLAGIVSAGPLDPTTAPQPTDSVKLPGTPISSLPFTIDESGHYYVTRTLNQGAEGGLGIMIDADNVTLDLGGFSLVGNGSGEVDAIQNIGAARNMTVRNGTVTGWSGMGVNAATALDVVVEGVRVSNNGAAGISAGDGASVSDCTASSNNGNGIEVGAGSWISTCASYSNGGAGIDAQDAATITDCTARGNSSIGMRTGAGSAISTCTSTANGGTGIIVGNGSTIENCVSSANGDTGINAAFGSVIRGCTVTEHANPQSYAISVGGRGVVADTTVRSNTYGISGGAGSVVRDNSVTNNDYVGIAVTDGSTVTGNSLHGNGAAAGSFAGILVSGSDNRIEGNTADGNDVGIQVIAAGNTVVGNSVGTNTLNFSVAAGNIFGPIISAATIGLITDVKNPYANFVP